jgi:phosphohistidine phosphatase SixA
VLSHCLKKRTAVHPTRRFKMKLFLLRHAPAEASTPDADRPLTPAGHRLSQQLAAFMDSRRYFKFGEIWSSPYLRARQTVQPLLDLKAGKVPFHIREELTPYAEVAHLLPEISRFAKSILIVGHNPHLTHLTRYLLGHDNSQPPFPFKKGALFVFKKDPLSPTGYTLSSVLTPSALGLKS